MNLTFKEYLKEAMVCIDTPENIWKNFKNQLSKKTKIYKGQSCHARTLKAIPQLIQHENLKVVLLGRDGTVTHSIIANINDIVLDSQHIKNSHIKNDAYYVNDNKRLDVISSKFLKDV